MPLSATPDGPIEAAEFVRTLEHRQGFKIACPEEIAYQQGFIGDADLDRLVTALGKSAYAQYLRQVTAEGF